MTDFEPLEPEVPAEPDQESEPCEACPHIRNEHWLAGVCMADGCPCAGYQGPAEADPWEVLAQAQPADAAASPIGQPGGCR